MTMSLPELLDRVIDDGIVQREHRLAALRAFHQRALSEEGRVLAAKMASSPAGFEACRGKTVDELDDLLHAARRATHLTPLVPLIPGNTFWHRRSAQIEIEWVCAVLSVGLRYLGRTGLVPQTERAVRKYQELVGDPRPHHGATA